MIRILIVKTGDTAREVQALHGDYDRWFTDAMPWPGLNFDVCDVTRNGTTPWEGYDGVIVTGSVSAAYRPEPWMAAVSERLRMDRRESPPLLCVCFGAQLLAQARGGQVVLNPEGWEIGSVEVELTAEGLDDPLFAGLPRTMRVLATHEDRIERPPAGARLLASNAGTPVQAFRTAGQVWGVQFHPEATSAIIRRLIDLRAGELERDARSHGLPADGHVARLIATLDLAEANQGRQVLDNFVRICRSGRASPGQGPGRRRGARRPREAGSPREQTRPRQQNQR